LKLVNGSVDKPNSGPAGVVPIPDRNEMYVGDGDGTVKVIDLGSNTIVDVIKLGLSHRADEMAYDAKHQIAAIAGPDEDLPILFFVSVTDRKILGNITFPNATNGIEQPAWNPADGYVYLSVPETNANPGGEVDVIDSTTFQLLRILPENKCNSAGIAFGPAKQLLLGCSQDSINSFNVANTFIIDWSTGSTISTINGVAGADQVTYDPTTNYYYTSDYQMLAGGLNTSAPDPLLAIIDAGSGTLVQSIPTDNITAHSVAVDPKSNKMIVPLAGSGMAIYALTNSTASSTPSSSAGASNPTGSAAPAPHPASGAAKGCFVSLTALVGAAIVAAAVI
jgi:hypothetical protein